MAVPTKTLTGGVGNFAVSTIDFDAWMSEPSVAVTNKTRKTKNAKEITNKIFAECASVTTDPFWAEKFNLAAVGKFPTKFSFHDNTLSYKKGSKNISLEMSNNPHEMAPRCMEFFRLQAGIFSPQDEQNSLELQYQRTHAALSDEPLTWGDANKKKIQEALLSNYVVDMKEIMKLTENEKEQLRQTIRLGISNKYFGKHNIKIENNGIVAIEGLLWNADTRSFYLHPDLKPVITRSATSKKEFQGKENIYKDVGPQFAPRWIKYLENLDKKLAKYTRGHRVINTQTDVSATTTDSTPITSTMTDMDDE